MKRQRFSLVELLVVIVIIVLLASIAVPAYFMVKRKSKNYQARVDLQQVKVAITNYDSDYSMRPFSTDHSTDICVTTDESINDLWTLLGSSSAGKPYLQLASDGSFADPWGNSYCVSIDLDYDNAVDGTKVGGIGSTGDSYGDQTVNNTSCVVWSKGADELPSSAISDDADENEDNINSWETDGP